MLGVALLIRVETGVKQLHQHRGDVRTEGERALNVAMAECPAGLTQVLGIGSENDDLAPAELCAQHQPIESVVLHVAAPDPREGLLKFIPDLVQIELTLSGIFHAEVVHPHAGAVRAPDLAGPFLLYPQTHVLQHGQGVGKRYRTFGVKHLELQDPIGRFQGPVEAHRQRVLLIGQSLHLLDVVNSDPWNVALAIVGAKGIAIAAIKTQPLFFAAMIE